MSIQSITTGLSPTPPSVRISPSASKISLATLESLQKMKILSSNHNTILRYSPIKSLNPVSLTWTKPTNKLEKNELENFELKFHSTGAIATTIFLNFAGKRSYIFTMTTKEKVYVGVYKQGSFDHSSLLGKATRLVSGGLVVENGRILEVIILGKGYRPFLKHIQDKGVNLSDVRLTFATTSGASRSFNAAEYQRTECSQEVSYDWKGLAEKLRIVKVSTMFWWPSDRPGGIEKKITLFWQNDLREPSGLNIDKKSIYADKIVDPEILEGLAKLAMKGIDLRRIVLQKECSLRYNAQEYLNTNGNCPYYADNHYIAISYLRPTGMGACITWAGYDPDDEWAEHPRYKTGFLQKMPFRDLKKLTPVLLSSENTVDKFTLIFAESMKEALLTLKNKPMVPFVLWPSSKKEILKVAVRDPKTGKAFSSYGNIKKEKCVYQAIDKLLKGKFGLNEYFGQWKTFQETEISEDEISSNDNDLDKDVNLWNYIDQFEEKEN